MKLRDNGIITKADYIGKTLGEASKHAENGGYVTRVVSNNGHSPMLDMDANQNRMNFIISNDRVTDVYGG